MVGGGQNTELKNLSRECAATAVFRLMDKKPYKKITVSEICNVAGISRNAFYRNYHCKDEIVRRRLYEITAEYRIRLRNKYNGSIKAKQMFTELFTHMLNNKLLFKKCTCDELSYLMIDTIFLAFRDYLHDTEYPIYRHCHIAGSFYSICTHWLGNDQPETPEQMAILFCKFNSFNESDIIMLPHVTDIDKLMASGNFKYREDDKI